MTSLTGLFLIIQPFSSTGSVASAQAPSDTSRACTVQVTARALDAGLSAVRAWAYFSRDIGEARALHAPRESGIILASPNLLERIRVAERVDDESDDVEIAPIVMGPEPNSARLWLNLFEAEVGEHEITVEGDRGRCRGILRVNG
ncbi:MAG: hypothetical protein ACOC8K_04520 [Gemmatimonadota bacterium]